MLKSANTTLYPCAEMRTSAALANASLITFSAVLTVVFAMAVSLLLYFAHGLNRTEVEQAQSLIEKSINEAEKSLHLTIKDYAFWGDAYKHLHRTVDFDWAYVRENFGPAQFDDFGFQGMFVLGPSDRTVYSVIEGKFKDVSAAEWIGQPIGELVSDARAESEYEEVATLITTLKGTPTLIAAAAITPGTDPTVEPDGRPSSVMMIVKILDPAKLDAIGENLGIKGLRIATDNDTTEPRVILHGDHNNVIQLQWSAVKPGRQLVIFVLPLIVLAGLTIFLMTWIIQRRNTKVARALDENHELLRNSQAALAISESRFRDVAEASSDWIWETDIEGRVTYLSDRFVTVTGLSKAQWLGIPIDNLVDLQHGTLSDWLRSNNRLCNRTTECSYTDVHLCKRIARIAARNIDKKGFRGTATDVTEEIESRQRIEYLSKHDVLTGLPNRSQLREFLERKFSTLLASNSPLAMLTIDLDRFKPVNDLLGHAAGDRVLNKIAARLKQCVRNEDIVARVGGDEFVMVISGKVEHSEVETICRRLIGLIEQAIVIDGQNIFVSASVGIAMAPRDASQAIELLRYSDIALYEAKASGRGIWRFYDGEMNARIVERRRLESDLRYAINHNELRLQFQPRFRISDGKMVGAEALVRWEHPIRGLLAPEEFIPIAEETGLITILGDWVLHTACCQAIRWPEDLFVSVNVSSKEFQGGQLVERVKTALITSGLVAARLELEVTESVMLEDADNALLLMRTLKSLGVRISMDDFGTGYSSLSYLRSFPFDGLKIDRSFVNRLSEDPVDLAIIKAVIGLGRALSLTVTAEGIETLEHLQLLDSVSCDEGQGYFLCRPMCASKFDDLLLSAKHVSR